MATTVPVPKSVYIDISALKEGEQIMQTMQLRNKPRTIKVGFSGNPSIKCKVTYPEGKQNRRQQRVTVVLTRT